MIHDTRFHNALLQALPAEETHRLAPFLEDVDLAPRGPLGLRDLAAGHVLFPERCLVSAMIDLGPRVTVEAWHTGAEGAINLRALMIGGGTPVARKAVVIGGPARRITVTNLRRQLDSMPVLAARIAAGQDSTFAQVARNAACARVHSLRQRLSGWLVSAAHRSGRDELPVTHALVGRLVGARRASVTTLLGAFEAEGALIQARGRVTILDKAKLEAASCPCHCPNRLLRLAGRAGAAESDLPPST